MLRLTCRIIHHLYVYSIPLFCDVFSYTHTHTHTNLPPRKAHVFGFGEQKPTDSPAHRALACFFSACGEGTVMGGGGSGASGGSVCQWATVCAGPDSPWHQEQTHQIYCSSRTESKMHARLKLTLLNFEQKQRQTEIRVSCLDMNRLSRVGVEGAALLYSLFPVLEERELISLVRDDLKVLLSCTTVLTCFELYS